MKRGTAKSGHFVHPLTRLAIMARSSPTGDPKTALCGFCGAPAHGLDHVVPESKGGSHAPTNLIASCRFCNTSKHDRGLVAFAEYLHPEDPAAAQEVVVRVRGILRKGISRLRDRLKFEDRVLRLFQGREARRGEPRGLVVRLEEKDLRAAVESIRTALFGDTERTPPAEYDDDVPF